jgi:hypothetical protein
MKSSRISLSRVHDWSYRQSSSITNVLGSMTFFGFPFFSISSSFVCCFTAIRCRRNMFSINTLLYSSWMKRGDVSGVKSVSRFRARYNRSYGNVSGRGGLTKYDLPVSRRPISTITGPFASVALKVMDFISNFSVLESFWLGWLFMI